MAKNKNTPRECQPCTACCDGWVSMNIDGAEVFAGHPCPHSTGAGCDDYDNRPQDPCVSFRCAWIIEDSPLPDWMKPSNAKVMLLFNATEWQGIPVDLAVPVGKKVPPRALNWLKQFAQENGRPFMYTEQIVENGRYVNQQTVYGFGPLEFQEQVQHWKEEGKTFW
ncbi:MAG: hypothetical protein ACWA5Q_09075 [bacterium]